MQVLSSNLTALTCAVTPKTSAYDPAAGMTVQVAYSGAAQLQAPGYVYADSWLEPSSWPAGLPEEGEAVLVPEGVTLVVNSSLAPVGALVVRGGLLLDPHLVCCYVVLREAYSSMGRPTRRRPTRRRPTRKACALRQWAKEAA